MERIYHTWDKWECYPAGFYNPKPPSPNISIEQCKRLYRDFLADIPRFSSAIDRILNEWPMSTEHYLSNERMNRIAWIGQASMCIETGISKFFCGGYFLLSEEQRMAADLCALDGLNKWLRSRGEIEISSLDEAASKTKADLY